MVPDFHLSNEVCQYGAYEISGRDPGPRKRANYSCYCLPKSRLALTSLARECQLQLPSLTEVAISKASWYFQNCLLDPCNHLRTDYSCRPRQRNSLAIRHLWRGGKPHHESAGAEGKAN